MLIYYGNYIITANFDAFTIARISHFPTVINWGNSGIHTLKQSHNTLMVVKHSFLQNPALVTLVR